MAFYPVASKYGNKKVEIDGHVFDSRKEAKYYLYLKEKEKEGEISNIRLQVPFEIVPAVYETQIVHLKTKDKEVNRCVQRAVHYIADFVYTVNDTGEDEVVDVKGWRTEGYRLKKKMMRAFNGIDIIEV